MRIAFSSRPAFGHVFAIAPLAAAARAAGHDVIFASGEEFLPRLESWGFETSKVGEAIEWGFQRAAAEFPELLQPEHPEFGARMFVDVLGPRSREDMAALIETTRPDLVVYEATDVGSGAAAAAAGVPVACHSLSVWVTEFMDAMRSRLSSLWGEIESEYSVDLTVGDVFLDIWPPSMQSKVFLGAAPERRLLRPGTWGDQSEEVPAWIKDVEGPLVFVSLGTIFWGKELLTKVLEGLADVDCDALVLAGVDATPDDFKIKNDRIRVTGFVNQAEVLKSADVVVHHGGAGTMLGSLARGLPALVLAEGADRPHTAASLEASGAGIRMSPNEANPEDITLALTKLIDDNDYRARAQAIKEEMEAMPAPEEVVAQLESFVTSRGGDS